MLRPTFLGFETAKSGLTAAQKGIDIAGQNLTNWDSAGYTRQRITQVAVATDSYRSRYASTSGRIGVAGMGVDITGIAQLRDSFLDRRYREENTDVGYYTQSDNILSDIQSALDEFNPNSDNGLRACILNINSALKNFSTNAYSSTHANIVATEFKSLTQTLQQLSSKLQSARGQQVYDLDISTQEVNKKLQQIAGINQSILEDASNAQDNAYFGPNELLDQRNLLLDELSKHSDFEYQDNADGTVTVTVNGQTAVSGGKYDTMELQKDETTGVVSLKWISSNGDVKTASGSLKASLDYINGRGPNLQNTGESAERGFLYYQDKLNAFAQTIASVANNVIPEANADGTPKVDGNGKTIYRQLLGALSDQVGLDGEYHVVNDIPITADNLSVSDAWAADSDYIIYQKTTDGDADNVGNYALAFANAITSDSQGFDANGDVFKGTFLDYVKNYSSTLGEDVSFAESRKTASGSIVDNLESSRDEVSGVVVDEEVTNMMLYQKSLAAASRLMTVLDEALDVLINKTGIVGR